MINSTREKIELATLLSKFCFRSLRDKMINLVMVIKYHFDFRLQFDFNKKSIFQGFTEILLNNGTCNYMINCSWETYELNKCAISLKMQLLMIVVLISM